MEIKAVHRKDDNPEDKNDSVEGRREYVKSAMSLAPIGPQSLQGKNEKRITAATERSWLFVVSQNRAKE